MKPRATGSRPDGSSLPPCSLCGEGLHETDSYSMEGQPVCMRCLLYLGPDRTRVLLKAKSIPPDEIAAAVAFLRALLTRNQIARLRETIRSGGSNWWVRLPEFGDFICRRLAGEGFAWDADVLDEIWNRLVEAVVEE